MHRKNSSITTEFLPLSPIKYPGYNSYKALSPKASFHSSNMVSGVTTKEEVIVTSDGNCKNKKMHMRNNSDFMGTPIVKTQMDEWQSTLDKQNIKNIEKRIEKLQAKIIKTEKGLFQWVMGQIKKVIDRIFPIQNMQIQMKNRQQKIANKIDQINQKIQNIRFKKQENHTKYINESLISEINQKVNEKVLQKVNTVTIQLMQTINIQMNSKFNQINQKIRKITTQKHTNGTQDFIRSNRKYFGEASSFVYEEFVKTTKRSHSNSKQNFDPHSQGRTIQHRCCINQIIYHIDPEGYLLDQHNHYLLNNQMSQIKLSEKELRMLRKLNIITPYI